MTSASERNTNGNVEPTPSCDSDSNNNNDKSLNYEKVVEAEKEKYTWYKKCDDIKLSNTYPNATSAERLRFLISRGGNLEAASKALGEYLKWRKDIGLDSIMSTKEKIAADNPTMKDDDIVWNIATSIAYYVLKESNLQDPTVKTLPRLISLAERDQDGKKITTLDGHRILQFLGGRIDLKQASASVYALAGEIFVDLIQDRQSMEKFVVSIDVRAGYGWSNHPANELMSFIKDISLSLTKHQPERLKTAFLFPVPRIANALWQCIKPFLDPVTVAKVNIYSGAASVEATPPKELLKYFSQDVVSFMEESRKSLFIIE